MFVKLLGFGQGVRYRRPFYVVCAKCGFEVSANTAEDALKLASFEGFVFDTEHDVTLCGDCFDSGEKAARG